MCDWSVLIWLGSPSPVRPCWCVSGSLQSVFEQLYSATPAQALHSSCRGCSCWGHSRCWAWGIGPPGWCLGWDTTGFSCCWCSGCEKAGWLLSGAQKCPHSFNFSYHFPGRVKPGLYNLFGISSELHQGRLDLSSSLFCFSAVYFQFVCHIIFQAFHSFVPCNLFFNELAWSMQLARI